MTFHLCAVDVTWRNSHSSVCYFGGGSELKLLTCHSESLCRPCVLVTGVTIKECFKTPSRTSGNNVTAV